MHPTPPHSDPSPAYLSLCSCFSLALMYDRHSDVSLRPKTHVCSKRNVDTHSSTSFVRVELRVTAKAPPWMPLSPRHLFCNPRSLQSPSNDAENDAFSWRTLCQMHSLPPPLWPKTWARSACLSLVSWSHFMELSKPSFP